MPHFSVHVDEVVSGSAANTYRTVLALKFPTGAGKRGRLTRLCIGGSGVAPQDDAVAVRLRRTNNATPGTPGSSPDVNTIGAKDPGSAASGITALGVSYSAEPGAKENGSVGGGSIYSKGTLIQEDDELRAAVWGPNQTMCIEVAPGRATAITMSVDASWEEF